MPPPLTFTTIITLLDAVLKQIAENWHLDDKAMIDKVSLSDATENLTVALLTRAAPQGQTGGQPETSSYKSTTAVAAQALGRWPTDNEAINSIPVAKRSFKDKKNQLRPELEEYAARTPQVRNADKTTQKKNDAKCDNHKCQRAIDFSYKKNILQPAPPQLGPSGFAAPATVGISWRETSRGLRRARNLALSPALVKPSLLWY